MSTFLQFHLLTSYPPSNLNRDDTGRPKTAMMGQSQRLRVSSQSLKRAWRTSDLFSELPLGRRTKDLGNDVYERLLKGSVAQDTADAFARQIAGQFGKIKSAPKFKKDDAEAEAKSRHTAREIEQLAHVSAKEWAMIDGLVARVVEGEPPSDDEIHASLGTGLGSPDIALFGRMLASSPSHNVEAAAQVAHAISVHAVTVEDDFFTAVDDLNSGEEDRGAGHMGSHEFAAGLFYQYVCVDFSLLSGNLENEEKLAQQTLEAFVRAMTTIAPSGKQNSYASRARASYVLVERGRQQPRSLSVAFLRAVHAQDILKTSIERLEQICESMDKAYGECADARYTMDVAGGKGSLDGIVGFVRETSA